MSRGLGDVYKRQDLLNIPLVLRERGSGTLDVFERALLQHNLKLSSLNVLMYLGSTESIKLFLEHTDCMGIVSIRSVHKELVAGNLRVVEIKGMPMLREFNFVQLQGQEGDYPKSLCGLRDIIVKVCNRLLDFVFCITRLCMLYGKDTQNEKTGNFNDS